MRCLLAIVATSYLVMPSTARADTGDPYDTGTMVAQAGGGLVGAMVGATVLGLAGAGLGSMSANRSNWGPPLAGAVIGGVIGGLVGTTVGVKLTGDSQDAHGSWVGTSLGSLGGVAAAGIVIATFEATNTKVPPLAAASIALVLVVSGPVIGYQLTNDGPDDKTTERRFAISVPVVAF